MSENKFSSGADQIWWDKKFQQTVPEKKLIRNPARKTEL